MYLEIKFKVEIYRTYSGVSKHAPCLAPARPASHALPSASPRARELIHFLFFDLRRSSIFGDAQHYSTYFWRLSKKQHHGDYYVFVAFDQFERRHTDRRTLVERS